MVAPYQYTQYPNALDNNTSLPVIIDLTTPVRAEVANRHREALLAIEGELGIQPSGTFATVRARLDALETGSGISMQQDVFTAIAAQTLFTLTYTPVDLNATELFIDGISQTITTDYTLTGKQVTYSGVPALIGGETIVVKYIWRI